MSQPTEVYASPGGAWRVYSYYNGGAYLITHRVRGTKLMSVHLQGDDAVQFEREFMDEDGYPIEGWAADLGYDTDSRSAEQTYRACLEIGLKMRNGLGDAQLRALRGIYQDY